MADDVHPPLRRLRGDRMPGRHVGVLVSSKGAAEAVDVLLRLPLVRVMRMKCSVAHPATADLVRRVSDSGIAVFARVPFGRDVLLDDHRWHRLSDEWIASLHRFPSRLHEAILDRMIDPVELPLRWLLSDSSVSAVLCGADAPWHVPREIAEATRRPPMTAAEREVVTRIAKEILVHSPGTRSGP